MDLIAFYFAYGRIYKLKSCLRKTVIYLYCSNCGAKISENDNYCRLCGAKLNPNIEVSIINHSKHEGFKSANKEKEDPFSTKRIDDIEYLINELDTKVQGEVEKHQRVPSEEDKDFMGPKKKYKGTVRDLTAPTPVIDDKMIEEFKIEEARKKEEEKIKAAKLKKDSDKKLDESKVAKIETPAKPKKSLKAIWKDFINEEDDEYSIFSGVSLSAEEVKEKAPDKENNSEKIVEKPQPKPVVEKSLNTDKNSTKVENKEEKKEKLADRFQKYIDSVKSKFNKPEDSKKKNAVSHEKTSLKEETVVKTVDTPKNDKPKTVNFEETMAISKEELSKAAKVIDDDIYFEDILIEKNLEEPKNSDVKSEKHESPIVKDKIEEKIKEEKNNKPVNPSDKKIERAFTSINDKFKTPLSRILEMGNKGIYLLTFIGVILTIIPLIISANSFGLSIAIFAILKLIFNFFEFYFPLDVSLGHTNIYLDQNRKLIVALINWIISQAFLLAVFFLFPRDSTLGFNLLGALTPPLWATIILFFITTTLAVTLLWKRIDNTNKISFIGWYAITFLTIELILKLFWIIVNFFFTTIF